MTALRVLVVDDDDAMRRACARLLRREGHEVHEAVDGAAALRLLEDNPVDLMLTDVRMPGLDGIELLRAARERWPALDVIVMTGFGTIENAVEAMRRGAADYVTKPFKKDELLLSVRRTARMRQLEAQVEGLREGIEARYRFEEFVAGAPAMRDVLEAMVAASRSSASLLITGESGTGKDLVARLVHFASDRAESPFVPVNCASLPAELIESELFGHVKGAYTGAAEARPGLIRKARGGTLFLDEITEMPAPTQAKLLRVLQDKTVRPVGGTEEIRVDFRLVAATNRDIGAALAEGRMREDLYYRVSVLHIHLPPLRQRPEDVIPLLRRFLEAAAARAAAPVPVIEPEAAEALMRYPWPGNVREVANLAERVVAMGVRERITAAEARRFLNPPITPPASLRAGGGEQAAAVANAALAPAASGGDAAASTGTLAQAERRALEQALARARGNKSEAARILGIARKTLYEKLRRHGLA